MIHAPANRYLVVRARVAQLHQTEEAAIDGARALAASGEEAIVATRLFVVQPSSTVISCA